MDHIVEFTGAIYPELTHLLGVFKYLKSLLKIVDEKVGGHFRVKVTCLLSKFVIFSFRLNFLTIILRYLSFHNVLFCLNIIHLFFKLRLFFEGSPVVSESGRFDFDHS